MLFERANGNNDHVAAGQQVGHFRRCHVWQVVLDLVLATTVDSIEQEPMMPECWQPAATAGSFDTANTAT